VPGNFSLAQRLGTEAIGTAMLLATYGLVFAIIAAFIAGWLFTGVRAAE